MPYKITPSSGIATGSDSGHKRTMATSSQEATIADVARAAGVSVSTVSRILNNRPDVSAETRERVALVIRDLGFTPHVQAQRLAAGRSRTIGLLYPMTNLTLMSEEFILGAAKAASEASYVFNLITNAVAPREFASLFRSAAIDGGILMEIHLNDWRAEYLHNHAIPFVMIGRCAVNDGISLIDMDFENGLAAAVRHLSELGHRHIGFIGSSRQAREQGYGPAVRGLESYNRACAQLNLRPCIEEADASTTSLFAATHALLDRHPEITALISMHGDISIGIVRALEVRKLRIPNDMSLIAFITSRTADLFTPPLTSIDFPAYQFGYQAAHMLIRRLNGTTAIEHDLPDPKLIVRKSTAAPPTPKMARMRSRLAHSKGGSRNASKR
jgi:DNA-binding LacI/PurR family transcriptional regulator